MEAESEQLDRERRRRPLAAAAALLSAILVIGGPVYAQNRLLDAPRSWLLDSLPRLEQGDAIGEQESLKLPAWEYLSDRVSTLAIDAALIGLSMILLALVMLFLARAVKMRGGALPRVAPSLPLLGAVPFTIGGIVTNTAGMSEHYDRLIEARTVDATIAVNENLGSALKFGQTLAGVGAIIMATGIILICLHAMRVGLLTRFLGILGILVGVILGFSPVMGAGVSPVQMVWLLAMALLLAGRWPGGDPPAWPNGVAVPWPSPAEVREARDRAAREATPDPPKPERTSSGPSPATSAKKKRKKRG